MDVAIDILKGISFSWSCRSASAATPHLRPDALVREARQACLGLLHVKNVRVYVHVLDSEWVFGAKVDEL